MAYEVSVAVKKGEVHAELITLPLSDFLKHIMHDATARGQIMATYIEKQVTIDQIKSDLAKCARDELYHADVLDATSPKYVRRRRVAHDPNVIKQKKWSADVVIRQTKNGYNIEKMKK